MLPIKHTQFSCYADHPLEPLSFRCHLVALTFFFV